MTIALGSDVHMFARPHRREELARCFGVILGGDAVRTVQFAAVLQDALDAGVTQVTHPGHPNYFMIPGGQVFTVAPAT